jgi:formaldehyde-activating enzyme involved in methanogenesis
VASVTAKSAGQTYVISVSHPVVVTGPEEATSRIIARVVEDSMDRYSVAFCGRASFAANAVKESLGVEIVSVDEPPAEKGVVY